MAITRAGSDTPSNSQGKTPPNQTKGKMPLKTMQPCLKTSKKPITSKLTILKSPNLKTATIPSASGTAQTQKNKALLPTPADHSPSHTPRKNNTAVAINNNASPTGIEKMHNYFSSHYASTESLVEQNENERVDDDRAELTQEATVEDTTNTDTPTHSNTNNTAMESEIMSLCDAPDKVRKRHEATVTAFKTLSYIKVILRNTTRIPAATCRQVDQLCELVSGSILELEATLHHAEAKVEVLQHISDYYTQQTLTDPRPKQNTATAELLKEQAPVQLAHAIHTATSTLIIKGNTERDPAEIENQIRKKTLENTNKVKKLRRIRNGVTIGH